MRQPTSAFTKVMACPCTCAQEISSSSYSEVPRHSLDLSNLSPPLPSAGELLRGAATLGRSGGRGGGPGHQRIGGP